MTAAEGRSREAWRHTSALMAVAANSALGRGQGQRPAVPEDFDPWAARDARARGPAASGGHLPIEALAANWTGGG